MRDRLILLNQSTKAKASSFLGANTGDQSTQGDSGGFLLVGTTIVALDLSWYGAVGLFVRLPRR